MLVDQKELPQSAPAAAEEKPIDKLQSNKDLHTAVLKKLTDRLLMSERSMSNFYTRWQASEKRVQAYINLPETEKALKQANSEGKIPAVTAITVPYSFATIWTVVTYLVHTFTGRKPLFQVGTYQKGTEAEKSRYMETLLQYNADHTRLVKQLFQFFFDGEVYGVGVLRTLWKSEKAKRTVWRNGSPTGLLGSLAPGRMRVREEKVIYEGNEVCSVDPFMFFPDPRVPMAEVNKRGEFVGWRSFESKNQLLLDEADGILKGVRSARTMLPVNGSDSFLQNQSQRGLIANGENSEQSILRTRGEKAEDFYQVDQMSVLLVPKDWGLGEGDVPEKWLFTILNKDRIVQAEPLDMDHGRHPITVIEPYTFGYGFGQPGLADMIGPLQDTISWFINSHIFNVRAFLNNMMVVDPSMIEMQDLTNPNPGKLIRLKRAAYGQDVRAAVQQLQVGDITRGHINDVQTFMRLADALASVNDNLKGIQDSGGRKTATEVRTAGEAGASRLAAHARLISAQGMVDLAEQMAVNLQQFLTMEFYLQVLGQEALQAPVPIGPESIAGDFYYPIHDGTLPLDRVALLDVWKEIFMGVAQDPQLRQEYNVPKIFEYIADLGGAKNLGTFKLNVASPESIAQGQANGTLAPAGQVPNVLAALGGMNRG